MPGSQLREPKKRSSSDDGQSAFMLHPAAYEELARFADENRNREETAKNLNLAENKIESPNSTNSISDKEETGDNIEKPSFINNVSGADKQKKADAKGRFNFIKKKGPLTAIILTLVGGGIGITGLLSPGLLIIQIKETMVGKFNTQLASMDIRTKKILTAKTTGGACTLIPVACKYSSMSKNQVARFEKAGIKINYDGETIAGRIKPQSIEFEGTKIDATEFYKKLDTDPNFRLSVKKAYNPLFASFYDSTWNKALFFIDKTGIHFTGDTDEAKLKNIQEATDSKTGAVDENIKKPDEPDATDKAAKETYEAAASKADDAAKDIANGANEVVESSTKAITSMTSKMALSTLSITGWIDDACTVYGAVRAVGFAAKAIRAVQLIKFASIFLKMADQIKAGGNPDSDDVSYLGNVLTTEVKTVNSDGSESVGAATDSFGYRYAAYGEIGKMPDSASQFLTGAGLAGTLILITSYIDSVLGGNASGTCKISQNFFVQIGSMVAGIALAIGTSGVSLSGTAIAKIVGAVAISAALMFLPALLKDIVAGVLVDDSTVGLLAGEAITSGSSAMMGKLANAGGNSPLTVEQAIAYTNLSNDIAVEYAEEDRLAYSPFDITNPNTFLGSFAQTIAPYLTNISSISSTISSIASLTAGSFASAISPKTYAATAEEFSLCQDYDYKELGLAADPYCNLIYGVPPEDLEDIDPLDVLTTLEGLGQIDRTSGAINKDSDLDKFQRDCINREDPIGYSGADFQVSDGKKCIIGESGDPNTKYYYLYLIDKRVEDGMSGDDAALEMAYEMGLDQSPNIAFYDGSNGLTQNNVANQSFFSKLINLISSSLTLKKAPQ